MIKLLSLMFLICNIAFAQQANETLKNIQDKFNSLNDFSANYKSVVKVIGSPESSINGKFYYKNEKKIRAEIKGSLILSDGTSLWNYNEQMNRVVVQSLENEPVILNFSKYLFEYPEDCKIESWENSTYSNAILLNSNEKEEFDKIYIAANEEFVINFVKVVDVSGNSFSFYFDKIKINNDLEDKFFMFNSPEGVQVIDLR